MSNSEREIVSDKQGQSAEGVARYKYTTFSTVTSKLVMFLPVNELIARV